MKLHVTFSIRAAAAFALAAGVLLPGCAYVKHVPPGQSLSAAMARKPELVAMPAPTPGPQTAVSGPVANSSAAQVLAMEQNQKATDSYTLGNLCLQQGHYPEAIAAYEAALKANPSLADAWNKLAIAYQDMGQDKKAMEAFKKYKMVALH